jgi:hypothetical protein
MIARHPIFASLLVSLLVFWSAYVSASDLSADIERVQTQISQAQSDVESYGGMVRSLALLRLQVLKLTAAMLEQKALADREGIESNFVLEFAEPDAERLAQIATELTDARDALAEAEDEAEGRGGLVGALAKTRVMTEKQRIAMLELAAIQALYGLVIPEIDNEQTAGLPPSSEEDVSAITPETPDPEEDQAASVPEWADPEHPEINYNTDVFTALHQNGYEITGHWGIEESKAEIDDSLSIFAINMSNADKDSSNVSSLSIGCTEGDTKFVFNTDSYLLTDYSSNKIKISYRIDTETAISDQ